MITYNYTPFEDRDVQYPGKRFITRPDSSVELCTIARTSNGQAAEGVIYNPGTPMDATSMNDQLSNIKNVFDSVGTDLAKKQALLNAGANIQLQPQQDGTVIISAISPTVIDDDHIANNTTWSSNKIDLTKANLLNPQFVDNILIGGTPTLPNHGARIADITRSIVEYVNMASVSVPANTATNIYDFTLDKGVYLLHVVARCSAGSQGRRHMALFSSADGSSFYGSGYFAEAEANAIGSEIITINLVTFVNIPADNSPIYIRVTVGSAITVTPRVQYIKIG